MNLLVQKINTAAISRVRFYCRSAKACSHAAEMPCRSEKPFGNRTVRSRTDCSIFLFTCFRFKVHCTQLNLNKISIPVLIYCRSEPLPSRMSFTSECIFHERQQCIASSVVTFRFFDVTLACAQKGGYAICGKRRTIAHINRAEGMNLLHRNNTRSHNE